MIKRTAKYAKYAFALGVSEGEGIRVSESFCVSPVIYKIAIKETSTK